MARRTDLSVCLTEARAARRLTQIRAAGRIGVSRNTLAFWEAGRSVPNRGFLVAIALAYDLDHEELVPLWEKAKVTRRRRRRIAANREAA